MIQVRKLVKVYPGPVAALQGIDIGVPTGMYGLVGPNGAGKTTFMRILAGLLEPTSGEVTVGGVDVVKDPMAVRKQLGYLPQDFGFYPNLTGEKMLDFLLRMKGVEAPGGRKKLVAELLDRVNLTFAAKRKLKGFSGGMRQRLGIAQAIAGDPRLVIVDEPTAGLDPEERQRFYRILAELAVGRTVLLSTHIVEDVAVLCPRFAVISRGRLVAETTPTDARNELAGRLYEGEGTDEELAPVRSRYPVTQSILVEGRNRIRIHVGRGEPPPGFAPVEPTLEDAYMMIVTSGNGTGAGPAGPFDRRDEAVGAAVPGSSDSEGRAGS
jgi:ABC-type multidrug transport system ATPase subunit